MLDLSKVAARPGGSVVQILKGISMTTSNENTVTYASIDGTTGKSHMSQHVFLASLRQAQQHKMSADLAGGEVVCLRGPLDLVKWKELHVPHDAIRAALARAGLVPAELMVSQAYLLKYGNIWNPVLALWANESQGHHFDLKKIHAVIEAVLAGLQRPAENDVEDICEIVLMKEEREAVHQVVRETLNTIGGRRLVEPVVVHAGESMFELGGKLGAKKSKVNLQPIEASFEGRFTGILVDPMLLLFKTERTTVELSFAPEVVDLDAVFNAMRAEVDVSIRTHKTTSASGREIHVYQPEVPFKAAGFLNAR